jgi:hypothetical protein
MTIPSVSEGLSRRTFSALKAMVRDEAEPLWRWLAQFGKRALIPGGSLICYFGGARINKLYRILDDAGLVHWWPGAMLHDQRQWIPGKFVYAKHKPILWYVKGDGRHTSVPDVVYAKRDKTMHDWAQGDGGVQQWIDQLTELGETIVDPFADTATWGRIAHEKGRCWIGADVESGGRETVVV